jgi:hypothetical protein
VLGQLTSGSRAVNTQRDLYSFTLTQATQLAMDPRVDDPNLVWTISGERGVMGTLNFRQRSSDFGGNPVMTLAPGSYTLRIDGNTTGAYSFRLLDLAGADWVADKLLHVVVPVLAAAAWAWVGPRPRVDTRDTAYALAWPVAWLAWTIAVGQVDGWVPYPFLDPDEGGWGAVAIACGAITALFVALFALVRWLDRRLPPAPR